MTLPTAKEIDRAFQVVEAAYRKFYLLKTARDQRALRMNEHLVKLQKQAQIVRRKEVLKRVRKVRWAANLAVPHLAIKVPGVGEG